MVSYQSEAPSVGRASTRPSTDQALESYTLSYRVGATKAPDDPKLPPFLPTRQTKNQTLLRTHLSKSTVKNQLEVPHIYTHTQSVTNNHSTHRDSDPQGLISTSQMMPLFTPTEIACGVVFIPAAAHTAWKVYQGVTQDHTPAAGGSACKDGKDGKDGGNGGNGGNSGNGTKSGGKKGSSK